MQHATDFQSILVRMESAAATLRNSGFEATRTLLHEIRNIVEGRPLGIVERMVLSRPVGWLKSAAANLEPVPVDIVESIRLLDSFSDFK